VYKIFMNCRSKSIISVIYFRVFANLLFAIDRFNLCYVTSVKIVFSAVPIVWKLA
jgi:hypothetical protein